MFLQALIILLAPSHSLFSDKNQNFLPARGSQEVEERGQFEIGGVVGGQVSLKPNLPPMKAALKGHPPNYGAWAGRDSFGRIQLPASRQD